MTPTDKVRLVYRCKNEAESERRVARAKALVGAPFLRLPTNLARHAEVLAYAIKAYEGVDLGQFQKP